MPAKITKKRQFQALVGKVKQRGFKLHIIAKRANIGVGRFYGLNSDSKATNPTNEELDRLAKVVAEL